MNFKGDGRIVAFTSSGLVRFNTDGSLDQTFSAELINSMNVLEIGPDDHIHISSNNKVYRLKPNGETDPDFFIGTGVNENHISAIEVQSDGKILIGGLFTAYNGVEAKSVLRLLPDGQADTSFNGGIGPRGQIFQIVERANKKIVIGGQFTHYNDQQGNLVQLNADGSLDRVIAIVMPNNITYIDESPDENITIAGEFSWVNDLDRKYLVRFKPDNTLNTSFNPIVTYTNSNGRFLEVNSKGEVLTGGFDGIFRDSTTVKKFIVKLDVFGRYMSSFSQELPGHAPWIRSSCIQDDDKMLISGFIQGHSPPALTRLNGDASIDESFQIGTGPTIDISSSVLPDVIVVKDTLLYVGGYFEKFNGEPAKSLVVLNRDGSVYQTFPSMPASSQVTSIAFQSDAKVIVTGFFDLPSGRKHVMRLHADGSIDETFSITVSGHISFARTDKNDRIYLGGMIQSVNGVWVSSLVRLLPDGSLDTTFDTGSGFNNSDHVDVLEFLPDGNVAVGGWFSSYQNQEANGFVILDESGARVPAPLTHFGKNSSTTDIKYRNGAIYLAGRFVKEDYSDVHGNVKIALEPLVIPAAPQNLSVSLQEGTFQLQWSDHSDNELAFILERSVENSSAFSAYDTLYANTLSTIDSNIEPKKEYFYRLRAVNDAGESSWSNIASQIWLIAPQGDVNLMVTREGDNQFTLSWHSTIAHHDGYIIESAVDPLIGYVILDSVSAETNTYVHIVEKEKTYLYKVVAYNAAGKIISNEVSSIISGLDSNESRVSVYPVPAKDVLYARIPEQQLNGGQWRLLSTGGQFMTLLSKLSDGISAIDVQNVPAGIYTMQYLQQGRVLISRRIIIIE